MVPGQAGRRLLIEADDWRASKSWSDRFLKRPASKDNSQKCLECGLPAPGFLPLKSGRKTDLNGLEMSKEMTEKLRESDKTVRIRTKIDVYESAVVLYTGYYNLKRIH